MFLPAVHSQLRGRAARPELDFWGLSAPLFRARQSRAQISQYLDATSLPFNWAWKEQFESPRFTSRLSQATRLGHLVTNVWNYPRSFERMAGLPPRRRSFGVLSGAERPTFVDSLCLDNIIKIPSSCQPNSRWRVWASSFRCLENPWCCKTETPSSSQ